MMLTYYIACIALLLVATISLGERSIHLVIFQKKKKCLQERCVFIHQPLWSPLLPPNQIIQQLFKQLIEKKSAISIRNGVINWESAVFDHSILVDPLTEKDHRRGLCSNHFHLVIY